MNRPTDIDRSPDPERILSWIMLAVLVWGLFHAFGAWTFNHDARRPLVVIVCVLGFLGFWSLMLAVRRRRLARGIGRPPAAKR